MGAGDVSSSEGTGPVSVLPPSSFQATALSLQSQPFGLDPVATGFLKTAGAVIPQSLSPAWPNLVSPPPTRPSPGAKAPGFLVAEINW